MNKNIFIKLLKEVGLSKKEFASLSKVSYGTVSNWSEDRPIPDWVESWLQNYRKAKISDEIIDAVRPFMR